MVRRHPKGVFANDADTAGTEAVSAFKRSVPVHVSHFAADDLEGCKDVAEFWQTHGHLPAALLAATNADVQVPSWTKPSPHERSQQPDTNENLMEARRPHERTQKPADSGSDPFAQNDPAWPSLEDLQARTAEAERSARMTLADLPDDDRTEAEELGHELALDSEEALTFMAELLKHEHLECRGQAMQFPRPARPCVVPVARSGTGNGTRTVALPGRQGPIYAQHPRV